MTQTESNDLTNNLEKRIRRPQEGNAAWRAAMARHAIKPGYVNRRRCCAIARHSGQPCGQLAMVGVPTCKWHGGQMMQTRNRLLEQKRNAQDKAIDSISREHAGRFKRSATAV
jgi:hypothetical protein